MGDICKKSGTQNFFDSLGSQTAGILGFGGKNVDTQAQLQEKIQKFGTLQI